MSERRREDKPRILVLSLVLAFYLVLVSSAVQVLLLAVATGVFIRQWSLFQVIPRTEHGYRTYFSGVNDFGAPTLALLAVVAAAVIVLDLRSVRRPRLVAPA